MIPHPSGCVRGAAAAFLVAAAGMLTAPAEAQTCMGRPLPERQWAPRTAVGVYDRVGGDEAGTELRVGFLANPSGPLSGEADYRRFADGELPTIHALHLAGAVFLPSVPRLPPLVQLCLVGGVDAAQADDTAAERRSVVLPLGLSLGLPLSASRSAFVAGSVEPRLLLGWSEADPGSIADDGWTLAPGFVARLGVRSGRFLAEVEFGFAGWDDGDPLSPPRLAVAAGAGIIF